MPTILGANTLSGGFEVANSLRFDKPSDSYLAKTFSSAGSTRKFTFSTWLKGHDTSVHGSTYFFVGNINGSSNIDAIGITDSGIQVSINSATEGSLNSTALFRDLNAWYHFVIGVDTEQGTASNRVKVYINGTQITAWDTETYPDQNYDFTGINSTEAHNVSYSDSEHNGYLCETVFIDGTQYAADSFGEFDETTPTIWKPKNVKGLTFGQNGFYLEYKQTGTSANSSGLGADTSGNDHHFSVNGLAAVDQSTDTCTNNYATINPLDNYYNAATFSEGNLKITTANSGGYAPTVSSYGVNSGKWYAEVKYVSRSASDNYSMIGVRSTQTANTNYLGQNTNDYAYYSGNGKTYSGGSASNYGNSYDQGETIGIYLDLDNNKLYFSKDGTLQNSGTGVSITAPGSTSLGNYFFSAMDYGNSVSNVYEWNFGGGTPTSISSGNADDNGYGNFEYSPNITGDGAAKSFYALNTKNIAEFG